MNHRPAPLRRVILADDEPLARERLRMLLTAHPAYEIVAECEDGAQAASAIVEQRPDLVFLDIRMPELSGIEVADALREAGIDSGHQPAVVFVTAYSEYALQAFDVHALDYLLKPVDRERLARALAHVEARLGVPSAPAADP